MESCTFNFDDKYDVITFDEALNLADYRHAAHCCIYSPNSFPTVESCESKAYISMQMRFDGHLGFPGGIVDQKSWQDVIDGLNRELVEEICLNKKHFINEKDYCFTHVSKVKKWCFHFFAKEVSVADFLDIEDNAPSAQDYGKEVMGVIRVPLFILKDNIRGFPVFLSNSFAGCAKSQLLNFLIRTKLMSYCDISKWLSNSQA